MHTTLGRERREHVTKAVRSRLVGWFGGAMALAVIGAGAGGACSAPSGPGDEASSEEGARELPAAGSNDVAPSEARTIKLSQTPPEEPPPCKEGHVECEIDWRLNRVPYDPTRPPGHNGLGIYIGASNNSNYCFADDSNPSVFCPERFVTTIGGVRLESRAAELLDVTYSTPVHLSRFILAGGWVPVELLAVRADQTNFVVKYRFNGKTFTASGGDLDWLRFEFPAPDGQPYGYQWVVTEVPVAPPGGADPPPAWLKRYESSYRLVFGGSFTTEWQRHCDTSDIARQASFLGRVAVGGLYADLAVDASAVTVSCETGAIDTCLAWGYAPWGLPNPGDNPEKSLELYGACLQAKRAAYFAGPEGGEYRLTSFTVPHTPIVVRDTFRIMGDDLEVDYVEAVWGPEGARCLNPNNARVPAFRDLLNVTPYVPPCENDWRKYGRLVTGRPTPPP